MADYLLPCECGREVIVSRAQAGGVVDCECGAKLQVPTLRGLAELRPAEPRAGRSATRAWDDRHRVGYLLALGAVTCLLVAGYLWASLPALPQQPSGSDYAEFIESAPTEQLFIIHNEATHGLSRTAPGSDEILRVRGMMSWGIGIVLAMALAAAASACIVIWNRPAEKK